MTRIGASDFGSGAAPSLAEVRSFVEAFRARLLNRATAISKGREIVLPDDLKKMIKNKVAPSALDAHQTIESAVMLAVLDLDSLGSRISYYILIRDYADWLNPPAPSLIVPFLAHMHSLRAGELYALLERGAEGLRYCAALSKLLEANGEDQSGRFSKQFKKRLGWRLRERHRLTHAHERPSLMSRMLDALGATGKREDVAEILSFVSSQVTSMFSSLYEEKSSVIKSPSDVSTDMKRFHDQSFENEARFLWELVSLCFDKSFIYE